MNLYKEVQDIAREALKETDGDFDEARQLITQICDSHEAVIYYGKGIQFCADHPTNDGEDYLEEIHGCIAFEGDTFGTIACRIAWATLVVRSYDALNEFQEEMEAA